MTPDSMTDLFDYNDVNGGPRILKYDAYMTAVAAALGEAGGIRG